MAGRILTHVHVNKQRQRAWGQFFTPGRVAVFAWEMLKQIIPPVEFPRLRVVDPAAGEGVFLSSALELGLLSLKQVMGVEIDPALDPPPGLKTRWFLGDGLLDTKTTIPDLAPGNFDVVIGNPPFGRGGRERLCAALARGDRESAGWLFPDDYGSLDDCGGKKAAEYYRRLPVEALFLRRFLALCRLGGWGAIILPDGYLANDRLRQEREDFCRRARILAVIGLPPGAFRPGGTPARTSLVFFRRSGSREQDGRVTLFSSMEYRGMNNQARYFPAVLQAFSSREQRPLVAGVARAPSKDLPRRRWNPNYWDPALTGALKDITFPLRPLADYIEKITYGPILPGKRPVPQENGIPVFGQRDLLPTGINPHPALRVTPGGEFDPERSRVRRGDLLFSRSGEGSLLRFRSGVYLGRTPANVSCFVDRIRLHDINPLFVWMFLMGKFGRVQILRLKNGVGTPNLNFAEIKSLRIPVLPEKFQNTATGIYLREIYPPHRRLACSGNTGPEYTALQRKMTRLLFCLDTFFGKAGGREEDFFILWNAGE